MKLLAIDYGAKRTGLAVGDDETRVVCPVAVIEAESLDELLRRLAQVIQEHAPGALVLGLPVNMDGTEGKAAKRARDLAQRLESQFKLRVHMVDERLTTHAADEQMRKFEWGRREKRSRRDALAAATILTDFLESNRPGGPPDRLPQ
jgi:putative Holliday junction resolvase